MTSHDYLRQGITGVARLRKLLWLPDNTNASTVCLKKFKCMFSGSRTGVKHKEIVNI